MNKKGEILRKYRKNNKLTQIQLAELVNVSSNHISEIERGNKGASKKLILRLNDIFSFKDSDLETLFKNVKEKKEISKKEELEKKEKELLETYDFIRQQLNIYSMIAKINRNLIEMNKCMENYLSEIEVLLNMNNKNIIDKVERPIKVTLKRIQEKERRLENLLQHGIFLVKEEEEN